MFGLRLWNFPCQKLGKARRSTDVSSSCGACASLFSTRDVKRPRQMRPVDARSQNGPERFKGRAHDLFYVASVGHSTFCTSDLNELQILDYYPEHHENEPRDKTPFMFCSYRRLERLEESQVTFLPLLREQHRLRIQRRFSMISLADARISGWRVGIFKDDLIAPSRLHPDYSMFIFSLGAKLNALETWNGINLNFRGWFNISG